MPCLLIYGDTGMGKTKIIRKFLRDHPATFDKATGVTTMPVVAMQMPAEPIERDIYGELLVSLGMSGPIDGATHRQKELCRGLLRAMGARMLIIDEVHAMLAGSFRQQRIFLNAIRFLANDLKAPLVCAGTDLARQALLTDPQLAERFEALHLRRWADDRFLAQLLSSLGALLPLRRPSALETTSVRKRVLEMTDERTLRILPPDRDGGRWPSVGGRTHHEGEFHADGLVLPLVAMTRKTEDRIRSRISAPHPVHPLRPAFQRGRKNRSQPRRLLPAEALVGTA